MRRDNKIREVIVRTFNLYDVHDALLKLVSIKNEKSSAQVNLKVRDPNKKGKVLNIALLRCANICMFLDFDVLRDNRCGQTDYAEADSSLFSATRLIRNNTDKLNVGYHPDVENPTEKKLDELHKYIVFRFIFFGGFIEVLAQGFKTQKK